MCYTEHTSLAPSLHICVYPYPPAYWSRFEEAGGLQEVVFYEGAEASRGLNNPYIPCALVGSL
jgi:hypothetical protein